MLNVSKEPRGSFFISTKRDQRDGIFEQGRIYSLADMIKFNGDLFYGIGSMLSLTSTKGDDGLRSEIADGSLQKQLEEYLPYLDDFELPLTQMASERLIRILKEEPNTNLEFVRQKVDSIHMRLWDELQLRSFLAMTPTEKEYAEATYPFGEEVFNKCSDMHYDIVMSSKCLSVAFGTSCVLHLMRVVDVALEAIGAPLSVSPKTNPSWHSFLDKLHKALNQHYGTSGADGWQSKNEFYCDIVPHLYAVKNAWRNPTFHAASKYDVEEAEEIFAAVRAMMKKLAAGMPITL